MGETSHDLLSLDPVPRLLSRTRAELAADFDFTKPIRISRAPGRLDVMGGIADYTGSLVCEMPLAAAAAVVSQPRSDGLVQVFSFNLLDEHRPFTVRMPIGALAGATIDQLRDELKDSGRRWAGYLIGCLAILQDEGIVDIARDFAGGISLAVLSDVPLGAGVSSSAAIEVATMMNLANLKSEISDSTFEISDAQSAMRIAAMCQRVENQIVGAPCGIMDQVTSCYGQADALLKLHCQPHEVKGFATLPAGVRVVGINSNIKHSVGGGMYGKTRCAAFMAHKMILEKMRQLGAAAGRTLTGDPMKGYLANLSRDDYKNLFRPHLPENMRGEEFIKQFGSTIDTATKVEPEVDYHVQFAADHHVLEAGRVENFVEFLSHAGRCATGSKEQIDALNKCGHLMYASHKSYTDKALLGADECDVLVDLVRESERHGLYGGKITGGGSGGTVAVLCNANAAADAAIANIIADYKKKTGGDAHLIAGSSPGAWWVGTSEQK